MAVPQMEESLFVPKIDTNESDSGDGRKMKSAGN